MKKILIAGILSISLFAHGESNDPGMKLLAQGKNKQALQTFEQECKSGNAWACGNAGLMLYMGMDVKKNIAESKKYYNKGCELNDIASCENLAEIAYKEQNIVSAKGYFEKVCGMKKYIKNSLDAKTVAKSCKKANKIK
jgi:TPR repeat protein